MVFSAYVLDTFVAPELSKFTLADVPDLTGECPNAPHWIGMYFLNSTFRGRFPVPTQQIAFAIIRRAHAAFAAYHRARQVTLHFLEAKRSGEQKLGAYHDAIDHWEMFVLKYGMVVDLVRRLNGGGKVFEKNDGSPSCRLYTIANKVKHLSPGDYRPNDTVPLWLTNDGLHSFGIVVSFAEAADELRDVAKLAEQLKGPKGLIEAWSKEGTP